MNKSSHISRFYKKSVDERQTLIKQWLDDENINSALQGGIDISQADNMIENAIGIHNLPLGIATNFLINNRDYLIPMVIEEPSVIAAASNAARMLRAGGGLHTSSDEPIMIGQIQITQVPDIDSAIKKIEAHKTELMSKVDTLGGSILRRGGGVRDIECRVIKNTPAGHMLIIHLLYDVRDAMGANAINTAVEYIADDIQNLTGGRVGLKILSNLSDRRKARAEGTVPASALNREHITGSDVVDAIVEASIFAETDPYRATTHNKGIMNGIDAVVIATGNDWRAVEAGSHAFAARSCTYTSLTQWRKDQNGDLHGTIEMPMALGIVGGTTRVHPTAQFALDLLGVQSARELAEIVVAVGLAQNLAAIRALAVEGIQHGHMRLHARQIAIAAGAQPQHIPEIVEAMIRENTIRLERAKALVKALQEKS